LIIDALKKTMSEEELKITLTCTPTRVAALSCLPQQVDTCRATQLMNLALISRPLPERLRIPEKLVKMLEEGTVQDDDPHVDGVTALHVAAQAGHLPCVELLLENGADPTIKDDEGRTPLLLAIKGNFGEVASALVRAGADPSTPYVDDDGESHDLLFDAIMVENEEFAKLLIEKGADIYHKDEKKVSTLLQASHRGLSDVVKMLLEKNAANGKSEYINEASDEGITPLTAAASEGHTEVVKILAEAKAEIDAKDAD
jgi:ankyrin repeat protein